MAVWLPRKSNFENNVWGKFKDMLGIEVKYVLVPVLTKCLI